MNTPLEHPRRRSRVVRVGSVALGGDHPVAIQSMTTTHTRDVDATLAQISRLAGAGADLVRVAVPTVKDADAIQRLAAASPVPLVADVHFKTAIALRALDAGAAKVRLNPGNMDSGDGLRRVLARAAELGRPIRFGVNSGSVRTRHDEPKDLAHLMVDVLLDWVRLAEAEGFADLVLSAKGSDAPTTLAAYRLLAGACDYPLHLGITAAGPIQESRVRSAIVLGTLLAEGIGDTVRVSLTGDPVDEVTLADEILVELGLRPRRGIRIVSCPTCGRCEVDLVGLVEELKRRTRDLDAPLTVAVMGCVVNGPGEAAEADVGVAAGKGHGVLFCGGKPLRKVPEADLLQALLDEINALADPA